MGTGKHQCTSAETSAGSTTVLRQLESARDVYLRLLNSNELVNGKRRERQRPGGLPAGPCAATTLAYSAVHDRFLGNS